MDRFTQGAGPKLNEMLVVVGFAGTQREPQRRWSVSQAFRGCASGLRTLTLGSLRRPLFAPNCTLEAQGKPVRHRQNAVQ